MCATRVNDALHQGVQSAECAVIVCRMKALAVLDCSGVAGRSRVLGCCRAAFSYIASQIQAVLQPLEGLPADIIAVRTMHAGLILV